jgi:hypothetical protein
MIVRYPSNILQSEGIISCPALDINLTVPSDCLISSALVSTPSLGLISLFLLYSLKMFS